MKTSEEMAKSVMERARTQKIAQTRRIIAVATAFICVFAIGLTAATLHRSPAPDTLHDRPTLETDTMQTPPATGGPASPIIIPVATEKGTLLRCLSAGAEGVAMGEGVRIPYRMELRVADIRGMTTDDAKALRKAEWKYAESVIEQHKGEIGSGDWSFIQGGSNAGIVTSICAGAIVVQLEDPTAVESFHMTSNGNGHLMHVPGYEPEDGKNYPNDYHLNDQQVDQYYRYGGINIIWCLHSNKINTLGLDPSIPLSTFSDTITVTITFRDGTVETHIIDIEIEDSGAVYAIYRGATTSTL